MTLAQGLYYMVANETNSSFMTFAAGAVLLALPITILYMLPKLSHSRHDGWRGQRKA